VLRRLQRRHHRQRARYPTSDDAAEVGTYRPGADCSPSAARRRRRCSGSARRCHWRRWVKCLPRRIRVTAISSPHPAAASRGKFCPKNSRVSGPERQRTAESLLSILLSICYILISLVCPFTIGLPTLSEPGKSQPNAGTPYCTGHANPCILIDMPTVPSSTHFSSGCTFLSKRVEKRTFDRTERTACFGG
jgi:hypothetical protein